MYLRRSSGEAYKLVAESVRNLCGTVTNDTKGPDKSHAISEARRALQASSTSFSLHHVDNRPLAQQWTLS